MKKRATPRGKSAPGRGKRQRSATGAESGAVETVQHEKNSNGNFQVIEQSDEDDIEDEYKHSSGDATGDMTKNGNDCTDETKTSCSFHRHVSCIITNEEVNALMKQNCKFKWETPAADIPKSKWVGTGEKMQETHDDHLHDVKEKLRDYWQHTLSDHLSSRMSFFSLCNSYRDIMHCNKKPFYLKGGVDSGTMDAYLMHSLNHVHRTRDVVIRNDAKLRNDADKDILEDGSYLDQGFTRPKVLFLLPLKSFARRIVKRLIQLSPLSQKDNAMGQFKTQFGESDDEMEKPEHSTKPADFDLLFAGDIDDHFLFGIKFTKKSMKLYSNFYSSDIIVASPLALKRKIDGEDGKEKDFDFLSSIEIVVVDHADVISMQNWAHLEAVFEQLNRLPSKEHGTNVMRIRPWYLDQHARYYRQTILLSSYLTPEMNALFNGLCFNYEGKVKMVTEYLGVLPKIQLEVRQVYERFDASSISEAHDARFDYFCNKVYPKIQDLDEGGGLLLFVSSYFEYIRISNFLKSKEASFCRIGEATSQQDISRSRLWFFEGKRKILLYSERSHFYHRYKLINMLGESKNPKCSVLFSRLDLLKLERIVGTSAARRLISSDKIMFVFC
ncbi:hypothetical protein ACP70R_025407 [Stipagrostis hirtigluma subsp. patula]